MKFALVLVVLALAGLTQAQEAEIGEKITFESMLSSISDQLKDTIDVAAETAKGGIDVGEEKALNFMERVRQFTVDAHQKLMERVKAHFEKLTNIFNRQKETKTIEEAAELGEEAFEEVKESVLDTLAVSEAENQAESETTVAEKRAEEEVQEKAASVFNNPSLKKGFGLLTGALSLVNKQEAVAEVEADAVAEEEVDVDNAILGGVTHDQCVLVAKLARQDTQMCDLVKKGKELLNSDMGRAALSITKFLRSRKEVEAEE